MSDLGCDGKCATDECVCPQVDPAVEARIRDSERHHIAALLERDGDTIVEYLSDPRDAVKLIAFLLRLQANRDMSDEEVTSDE